MDLKYGSIKSENAVSPESIPSEDRSTARSSWSKALILFVFAVATVMAVVSTTGRSNSRFATSYIGQKPSIKVKDLTADDIPEMYYDKQLIYHDQPERGFFSQRYYEVKDYFGGPGYPIFVIMAGEDDLDEILYPFVWKTMGQKYKAYSINIEHRYYGAKGESWPMPNPSNQDLLETLNTRVGLQDAVRLLKHKQKELGCGPKGTKSYCPVLTVGGSYPGFLAGLMRILYPDAVDIGYASSAPFHIYSHKVSSNAYFDKITLSAENAYPGCAAAVKKTLLEADADIRSRSDNDIIELASDYGLCTDTLPAYIQTTQMFSEELMESIASHFAEQNMGYYPPRIWNDLFQSCMLFQNDTMSTKYKIATFLKIGEDEDDNGEIREDCFDLTIDLPPYPNATVSASDWSGVGGGPSGVFWDFQCCQLMPECGFSNKSMFPERPWTLKWETDHCLPRFGIKPDPEALVKEYKFGNLTGVKRLLFVNGLVDGWSAASYTAPLPEWGDDIKVVNILNGAHHSELRQSVPNEDRDTPDLIGAYWEISKIVGEWLDDVRKENMAL